MLLIQGVLYTVGKKFKKSTSLVLTTLSTGMLATPQNEVHAWRWHDVLWCLMPEAWWRYLFVEDTREEKVINKDKEVVGDVLKLSDENLRSNEENVKRKERVISILKEMDRDLHKNDVDEIYRASFNNISPISVYESYNFCVPYFKDAGDGENVGTKAFAHIEVKDNRVLFYRFIDTELERYKKEEDKAYLEEDIFEEISLEDEGAVERVENLASKVLNINKLFRNLFDICKQLDADVSEESNSRNITFFFPKDNKSRHLRYFSKKIQSVAKNKYIWKVVIGAKTEKITIFYRIFGESGKCYKKEYNLLKDKDITALLQTFSENSLIINENICDNSKYLDENC